SSLVPPGRCWPEPRCPTTGSSTCPTSAVLVGRAWSAPRSSAVKPARSTTCPCGAWRSEEHTSELQSLTNLVCRLLLAKNREGFGSKEHIRVSYAPSMAELSRGLDRRRKVLVSR